MPSVNSSMFWPSRLSGHPEVQRHMVPSVLESIELQLVLGITQEVELAIVNKYTAIIPRGLLHEIAIPPFYQKGAFHVLAEEIEHSRRAHKECSIIAQNTGVTHTSTKPSQFLTRLRRGQAGLSSADRRIFGVLSVALLEFDLSEILRKTAHDLRVSPSIREYLAWHAGQEVRHNKFFRALYPTIWHQLPAAKRRVFGPLLPDILLGLVEPNYAMLHEVLTQYGMPANIAYEVLTEVYPPHANPLEARDVLSDTLRVLQEIGVLEDFDTATAFYRSGLLV